MAVQIGRTRRPPGGLRRASPHTCTVQASERPWESRRTRVWARVGLVALVADLILAIVTLVISHGAVLASWLSPVWFVAWIGWTVSRHLDLRNFLRARKAL